MRSPRILWLAFLVALPVPLGATALADDGPDVTFLDVEAGRKAIVDETLEPYFALLQPNEMEAKTGSPVPGDTLDEKRDACRERYQDAVRAFTEPEQEAIRWYVERYHALLREPYPRFAKTPWCFVKLARPAEGGLPHTRGRCIVLPPNFATTLVAEKASRPNAALATIGSVLLHEQLHVVQRANAKRMERFYRETWKLIRPATIERCDWLVEHQVVNPDGVDTRWVFRFEEDGTTRWIQPDVMLRAGNGPWKLPRDLVMVALELEKTDDGFAVTTKPDGTPVYAPLLFFHPYQQAFPGTHLCYHPHEAMADLFTKIVVHDLVLTSPPEQKPALQRYRPQFRSLLK